MSNLVAQPGRLLEPQVRRRLGHLLPHLVEQRSCVAFQEHPQPLDVLAVFFLADPQVARRRALVDRRQQARPKPPPALVVRFDVERAGAELEHLLQHLHRAAQAAGVGERAVELRRRWSRGSRVTSTRGKVLVRGDLQVRERLVVLRSRLYFGWMSLTSRASISSASTSLSASTKSTSYASRTSWRSADRRPRRPEKVAARARPQVLRLADVDHAARPGPETGTRPARRETCCGPSPRRGRRTPPASSGSVRRQMVMRRTSPGSRSRSACIRARQRMSSRALDARIWYAVSATSADGRS